MASSLKPVKVAPHDLPDIELLQWKKLFRPPLCQPISHGWSESKVFPALGAAPKLL